MDVARPYAAVIPTLDGPVLEVLARTSHPLTGREVHRLAGAGSESGVRLVLARLVEHGLVSSQQAGQATLYVGNRDHLAWLAVDILTTMRQELATRVTSLVDTWDVPPLTIAMFGSAARRDGHTSSDIDLLVVRSESPGWETQLDQLRERVEAWTGNPCQIYDLTAAEYREHVRAGEPIVEEWRQDAVVLFSTQSRLGSDVP